MTPPTDLRPYLDELERFADGQLTESEQEAFEQRLEDDSQLSAAYLSYEQFTADLRWVAGHETLRHRLQSLDRRLDQRQEALLRVRRLQRRTQTRWAIGGAVLLVVLALGAWLLLRARPISPDEAWARYYAPEPGLTETAAQQAHSPLLVEAMRHYREGRYPAAMQTLRRMPSSSIGADTLFYFTGVTMLRQDDAASARSYLMRATRQPGSALIGKANYHLGMAQWRTGQLKQARTTLQAVATDPQNPYQLNARQVLQANVLTVK